MMHFFNIDSYALPVGITSIAGIYITGWLVNDQSIRNLGVRLTEATTYASILTLFIKGTTGRSRPLTDRSHFDFRPFSFAFDQSSLSSGHATFAFAFSTVMATFYNNTYWKIAWYLAAGLVCTARVYHNVHWISDVILGGSIGYFAGQFVF
jgi:membrane-associated phospholipid phosphatase